MSPTPDTLRATAAIARNTRLNAPPEVMLGLRRDLAEANIAAAIDRALSKAPPLSDEQCERLADRLRGVPADDAVA